MSFYLNVATKLFRPVGLYLSSYFIDLKKDLKMAGLKYTVPGYLNMILLTSLFIFIGLLPTLSFVFAYAITSGPLFTSFIFSFLFAFFLSTVFAAASFYLLTKYPKTIISSKAKKIDNDLSFSSLYLSTIAGTKLPLNKVFEIFSKFTTRGEISNQINAINEDVKLFGHDIYTALERSIERSPSKSFKELMWGILSTIRSGANLSVFLEAKSRSLMTEYRRKLYESSRTLTVYIEIYLTAIVLGSIFFTILTAVISGISVAASGQSSSNILMLQVFLVFVFMPVISIVFLYLVKGATPTGD